MTDLRSELAPLPPKMRGLPVDDRGYVVPWFVATINGKPDHRIVKPDAVRTAVIHNRCWVCGSKLGAYKAFVIGPMCAINRISSEPPAHLECATWSAINCPFLSRPHARRREAGREKTGAVKPAGVMVERNPGVTMVWTTKQFRVVHDNDGRGLLRIGDPDHVEFYREGRSATRDEVIESIDTGLPILREAAEQDGERALAELGRRRREVEAILP